MLHILIYNIQNIKVVKNLFCNPYVVILANTVEFFLKNSVCFSILIVQNSSLKKKKISASETLIFYINGKRPELV